MKLTKESDVALADIEGFGLCVVHRVYHERPITKEEQKDIDPYQRFVNAKTLTDVLLCAEHFGSLFPPAYGVYKEQSPFDPMIEPQKPKPLEIKRAFFPEYKRRTYEKQIRDVVEIWGFDESKYSMFDKETVSKMKAGELPIPKNNYLDKEGNIKKIPINIESIKGHLLQLTLVSDWLQAAHDLKMACLYLAGCNNPDYTRYEDNERTYILSDGDTPLQQYYRALKNDPTNELDVFELRNNEHAVKMLWNNKQYIEESKVQLGCYAASAFNIMLNGCGKKFNTMPNIGIGVKLGGLSLRESCPDAIHSIWQHFAELCNKKWIARCAECGNVMICKRKEARITCSDACKTKRSVEGKGDPARKPGASIGKAKNKSNERR